MQTVLNDEESLMIYLFDRYFGKILGQALYFHSVNVVEVLELEPLILDNGFEELVSQQHQNEQKGHVFEFVLCVLQEATEDQKRDVVDQEGLQVVVGALRMDAADQCRWVRPLLHKRVLQSLSLLINSEREDFTSDSVSFEKLIVSTAFTNCFYRVRMVNVPLCILSSLPPFLFIN
jgi:hypothetical protein